MLADFLGKKRANSSNVWDHFGFQCNEDGVIADKTKAICRHCSAEIRYKGGNTSNLATHFSSCHLSEKKIAQPMQPKINSAFGSMKMYPKTSTNYLNLQQKVAEYIVAELKPFSTVDNESFRSLCAALNPRFDMPSKTLSNTVMPKMYLETKLKVQAALDDIDSLAITADSWTSNATESY